MKLENMIYLHLVHHYHFETSPGIFWFQAQDVQPQWVPQWTRDMQKPGAIPLFSILFCKNLVRFYCFFLLKTWWGSIVVVFGGAAKHAVIERI